MDSTVYSFQECSEDIKEMDFNSFPLIYSPPPSPSNPEWIVTIFIMIMLCVCMCGGEGGVEVGVGSIMLPQILYPARIS